MLRSSRIHRSPAELMGYLATHDPRLDRDPVKPFSARQLQSCSVQHHPFPGAWWPCGTSGRPKAGGNFSVHHRGRRGGGLVARAPGGTRGSQWPGLWILRLLGGEWLVRSEAALHLGRHRRHPCVWKPSVRRNSHNGLCIVGGAPVRVASGCARRSADQKRQERKPSNSN